MSVSKETISRITDTVIDEITQWAVRPPDATCAVSPVRTDIACAESDLPGFATALMKKDLGLAMDAVSSTGSAAPLGSHAAEICAEFAAANADKGFSAVIEMIRGG